MRIWKIAFVFLVTLLLSACSKTSAPATANEISVGTIAGPETQLMEVAKNVAQEKYGVAIKIVSFTDYSQPNHALADGQIDANLFQHVPYLIAWKMTHGNTTLVPVAKTFMFPMGIYSYKLNRLSELPQGATVAIPDDPTNRGRALIVLQSAKLITLKPENPMAATVTDIVSNPYQLHFKLMNAAQLPKALAKVDIAVINADYAIAAGLHPEIGGSQTLTKQDSIFLEPPNPLYANVIVVQEKDVNNPKVQALIDALRSPQVLVAAQSIFHGNAVKAW